MTNNWKRIIIPVIVSLLLVVTVWFMLSGRMDMWLMERNYDSYKATCDCINSLSQDNEVIYSQVYKPNLDKMINDAFANHVISQEDIDAFYDNYIYICPHGYYFAKTTQEGIEKTTQYSLEFIRSIESEILDVSDDYKSVTLSVTKKNVKEATYELRLVFSQLHSACIFLQTEKNETINNRYLEVFWVDSASGKIIHTEKEGPVASSNLNWDVPYDSFSSE